MATSPTTTDSRPARRRGWGQFSLVSLLLLAVIGCLVGAYIAELRRRQSAEALVREKDAEIRQNRIDLGLLDDQPNVLTITDPTKVYVRQLPSFDPGTAWRWRIYLPPRTQWQLRVLDAESLEHLNGYPRSGTGTDIGISGEFTLEGRIVRHLNGRPYVELKWGKGALGSAISEPGLAILQIDGERTLRIAGQKAQESFAADATVELLREHVKIPDDRPLPTSIAAPGNSEPSREYGFSIYFEPGSMAGPTKRRPAIPRPVQ